jgi:hypothetical protein
MYRQPAEKLQLTKSDHEVVAAVRSSGMSGVGHFRPIDGVCAMSASLIGRRAAASSPPKEGRRAAPSCPVFWRRKPDRGLRPDEQDWRSSLILGIISPLVAKLAAYRTHRQRTSHGNSFELARSRHRMRVTRIVLGLTEQEAADDYGVTLQTYRKYEAGRRREAQRPYAALLANTGCLTTGFMTVKGAGYANTWRKAPKAR